jgi:hypothetical protein
MCVLTRAKSTSPSNINRIRPVPGQSGRSSGQNRVIGPNRLARVITICGMFWGGRNANCLDDKWKGRVGKLNIGEAEEAVLSLDWSDANRRALNQIAERRGLRNLIAHFAVRRFPNDDAFLFFTKSDRDFKRLYGRDPESGTIMTAILECSQLNDGFRHIHELQKWVTKASSEAEMLFLKLKAAE